MRRCAVCSVTTGIDTTGEVREMSEEQRYAAVQQQIKDLQDAAAMDRNPMTAILRALLCAEMYTRNERTHQRVMEANQTPTEEQGTKEGTDS